MTIVQEINKITVAHGGTPKGNTISQAIDALNDALAGSDQPEAHQIDDAIELLGQHIGGASPSGTIEITENGEYDVAQYATADVNVSGGGSSDFSTATVTLVNSDTINGYMVYIPIVYEIEELGETYKGIDSAYDISPEETLSLEVPLYKDGETHGFVEYRDWDTNTFKNATISVSGNITNNENTFTVTGDGTITITGMVSD